MSKKSNDQQPIPPAPGPMREAIDSKDFSLHSFSEAIDALEEDIDEPDPYWLESALDHLADCLVVLIPTEEQGGLKTSPPSKILERIALLFGYGSDAADALQDLEGATDSSFYEDDGLDKLESIRDNAVEQLRDLHDELAKLFE